MGMYTKYIIITLTLYNGNRYIRRDRPRIVGPGGPVPLSAVGKWLEQFCWISWVVLISDCTYPQVHAQSWVK